MIFYTLFTLSTLDWRFDTIYATIYATRTKTVRRTPFFFRTSMVHAEDARASGTRNWGRLCFSRRFFAFLFLGLLQVVRLRAKHTEGFDPRCALPVLKRLRAVWSRPVAFAPQPWAPGLPAGFWVAAHPHVCSPACLPAASTVLRRAHDAAAGVAGRPNGPGEGSTESVSPAPLTGFPVPGGCWIVPGSGLPNSAMSVRSTCAPLTSGIPHEMLSAKHPCSVTIYAAKGECVRRVRKNVVQHAACALVGARDCRSEFRSERWSEGSQKEVEARTSFPVSA